MTLGDSFSTFIASTELDDVPPTAVDHAKKLALKTVAGMVAGASQPAGRRMADHVRHRADADGDVGVVGAGFETDLHDAVAANAMFAHVSELEDDKMLPGEDTSWDITTFPVTLPLAAAEGRTGEAFLLASILSLEVQTRLSSVVRRTGATRSIVRAGAVASAVGATSCLSLDREATANALGMAIGGGSVFTPNTGFDAHYLDSVFQCLRGLQAAEFARAGFDGNPDFESLFAASGDEARDPSIAVEGLGERWSFLDIGIKKYPCCFHTHRHLDAIRELVAERAIDPADVEEVVVETGTVEADMCDRPAPTTREGAKFSFQHLVASMLVDGDVTYRHLTEASLADPRYRTVRDRVVVDVRPEWTRAREGPAIVRLRLTNGETLEVSRRHMIGSREDPLPMDACLDLFHAFADEGLPASAREDVANGIANVEELDDVGELLTRLTNGSTV